MFTYFRILTSCIWRFGRKNGSYTTFRFTAQYENRKVSRSIPEDAIVIVL